MARGSRNTLSYSHLADQSESSEENENDMEYAHNMFHLLPQQQQKTIGNVQNDRFLRPIKRVKYSPTNELTDDEMILSDSDEQPAASSYNTTAQQANSSESDNENASEDGIDSEMKSVTSDSTADEAVDLDTLLPLKSFQNFDINMFNAMESSGYWGYLEGQLDKCLSSTSDFAQRTSVMHDDHHSSLTTATQTKVVLTADALRVLMTKAKDIFKSGKNVSWRKLCQEVCSYRSTICYKTLMKRFKEFINNFGSLSTVKNKSRSPYSLIEDEGAQDIMRQFMDPACRAQPPASASDFRTFILKTFLCHISVRTAQVWLHRLGYRYRATGLKELYNDGHNRPDVKLKLSEYTDKISKLAKSMNSYGGEDMEKCIPPTLPPGEKRTILYFHDESACHTKEQSKRSYRRLGATGTMQGKNQGELAMIAAYVNADTGFDTHSMAIIKPGSAASGKDAYWDGPQTQKQARTHLEGFHSQYGSAVNCVDVYDNSTGHDCAPVDGLSVDKLNKNPGYNRKKVVSIREGSYLDHSTGEQVKQSMYFQAGDILLTPIKEGAILRKDGLPTPRAYDVNYCIQESDKELIGAVKGSVQLLRERKVPYQCTGCFQKKLQRELCATRKSVYKAWLEDKGNDDKLLALVSLPTRLQAAQQVKDVECSCCMCTLAKQDDFVNQKTGLEEVYDKFNLENDNATQHSCMFLPKFHPELNPIERCWGRMKWHYRRFSDGTMATLIELMKEGLSEDILPLSLIRKYFRLCMAYLIAYKQGHDVVQAESWLKKHRAHRSYSEKMDAILYALYFPSSTLQPWHELLSGNRDPPHDDSSNTRADVQNNLETAQSISDHDHHPEVTAQVNSDFNMAHENNEAFDTFDDDVTSSDIQDDADFFVQEYVEKELNYEADE